MPNPDTIADNLKNAESVVASAMQRLCSLRAAAEAVGLTTLTTKLHDLDRDLDGVFDLIYGSRRDITDLGSWWRTRCAKPRDHNPASQTLP